jgi:hypothetical protein
VAEVQWRCWSDTGEVDYPPDINAVLEQALNNLGFDPLQTVEFTGHRGMMYIADLTRLVQHSVETGKERQIVRYVNGKASSWITWLDPQTGRNYYLDTDRASTL